MSKSKNIYLISQEVNSDYDTFDSAVVIAESEEQAKLVHPRWGLCEWDEISKSYVTTTGRWRASDTWCEPKDVQVQLIGKLSKEYKLEGADKYPPSEVICASFNAG